MNRLSHRASRAIRGQRGFTMIEVLIALVVLAVGLLGLAMLQTMNLRFTQSANQRTQATNLAYEMLDQMRANRVLANSYLGDYTAKIDPDDCPTEVGIVTSEQLNAAWECRLGKALGGNAKATVSQDGTKMKIAISWKDERWRPTATDPSFEVETQL